MLVIANSAAMNIGVYISFKLVFSRYMARREIAGSYGDPPL